MALRGVGTYFVHADGQQPGAERMLSKDELRPAGGAALLRIEAGEDCAFLADAIDVRRLVAHNALAIGADVVDPDTITPQDQDVGFLGLRQSLWHAESSQRQHERSHPLPPHPATELLGYFRGLFLDEVQDLHPRSFPG